MSSSARQDVVVASPVAAWRRHLATLLVGGRGARVLPAAAAAVVLAYPWISGGNQYWIREISLIAVFSLVVSGVNLSFGYAGEIQFGQLFMFAVGAYVTAALATRWTDDIVPLLIVGGIAATITGALIAIPAVRVGGWALAIASFYLVITLPSFVRLLAQYTGGFDGIPVVAPKLLGDTLSTYGLYEVTVVVGVIWFAAYRNLVRSRFGVLFRTLRESPVLTSSLGYSPRRLKVVAYAISAFPAGVAGCLYGFLSQFLIPELFTLTVAIGLIAAAVLGGVESVYGAIVGAALLQLGPMSSLSFQRYAIIAYGAFLIIAGIVFRRGLGGMGTSLAGRLSSALAPGAVLDRSIATGEPAMHGQGEHPSDVEPPRPALALATHGGSALAVHGVSKAYAGVQALRDVSLSAVPGEITALIGSNGSGKTTLLNVICGHARNEEGFVEYGGRRLTGLAPHQVARLQVGRTFQTPNIPRGVSVLDVVASGRFAGSHLGIASAIMRLPPYWRARREDRQHALAALELVGAADLADEDASSQPLGTRRLIEVARMLCGNSSLLLLDEPASGLSEPEVRKLGEVITVAAETGATVMLIEHNFNFVTSISATAYVLHFGEMIATGPAATIGTDAKVIQSYLGSSKGDSESSLAERGTR